MKPKILIVDDSLLARRITRKILEELDYEVEDATDGAQALERYALNRPSAVILDMVMHGMYGLEVLIKLRELDPAVMVVVATADIQKSTRDQCKEAGAMALVNKPINKEELAEVLGRVLAGGNAWN